MIPSRPSSSGAGMAGTPRSRRTPTHFDRGGRAQMVNVGAKARTHRVAVASGRILMRAPTLRLLAAGRARKGDVLGVGRVPALQAAKRAPELIPLAPPIAITRAAVDFELQPRHGARHAQGR